MGVNREDSSAVFFCIDKKNQKALNPTRQCQDQPFPIATVKKSPRWSKEPPPTLGDFSIHLSDLRLTMEG
jgi:hypothetical protein